MTKSSLRKTEWGCFRDDSRGADIIRCEREEDNDYGPAGEVYWIIRWDGDRYAYSDPFFRLWQAKEALAAQPNG